MKHILEIGRCKSASITSVRTQAKGARCRRTSTTSTSTDRTTNTITSTSTASTSDLVHDSTGAACTVGTIDLLVQLPSGQLATITVERRTPMLDVLVKICTRYNLQPSEYTLQPVEQHGGQQQQQVGVGMERSYRCKPSTQVGLVGTRCVRMLPKAALAAPGKGKGPGTATGMATSTQAPFEPTHRLQVHLPRHQLYVTRVGGRAKLADILHEVCLEKHLDPDKYVFRHPVKSDETLDLNSRIGDYQLTEVHLVASDQISRRVEEDRYKLNGGGVYHSMPRKPRYVNGDVGPQVPLQAQARGRLCASYTDLFTGGAALLRKKRPAPTPPVSLTTPVGNTVGPDVEVDVDVAATAEAGRRSRPRPASLAVLTARVSPSPDPVTPPPPDVGDVEVGEVAAPRTAESPEQPRPRHENGNGFSSCHSRNSSDSSGYHEASLLSDHCVTPPLETRGGSGGETPPEGHSPSPPNGAINGLSHWPRYDQNYNRLCCSPALAHSVPNLAVRSRKKKAAPPPPILRKASVISTTSSPTLVTSQAR